MSGSEHFSIYGWETVDTGLPKLNDLFAGGLPTGAMIQIFGRKGAGKSILAFQLAFNYTLKKNRSVIYLDTELGFDNSIKPHWYETFCRRFGDVPLISVRMERSALSARDRKVEERELKAILCSWLKEAGIKYDDDQLEVAVSIFSPEYRLVTPKNVEKPGIFVLRSSGLVDILAIHGVNVEIIVSDAGRVETRLKPGTKFDVKLSPLGQLCSKYDVGLMVYDSISMPFKSTFAGTQDLPGRAAAMNLWFGRSQMLCSQYDCTVIALNHETIVPLTQKTTYYGGGPVGFDFKYSFHMKNWDPGKMPPKESLNPEVAREATRILWSQRFPNRADYGKCVLLRLDDNGFTC